MLDSILLSVATRTIPGRAKVTGRTVYARKVIRPTLGNGSEHEGAFETCCRLEIATLYEDHHQTARNCFMFMYI